ncbi:MAG: META domain-containing protein [bacterium]|nr:META domain-containing protein [bacterium]
MKQISLPILLSLVVFVGLLTTTGCRKSKTDPNLEGVTWVLEYFKYPNSNTVQAEQRFSITFNAAGTMAMEVDCNACNGEYTAEASQMTFSNILCTEAYCGDESQDWEFHNALVTVTKYEFVNNSLILYFDKDRSTLHFRSEILVP